MTILRFGTKLFRQIFCGYSDAYKLRTACADLFLFCYKDFKMSLSKVKQSEVIKAFSSTSRYLDDFDALRWVD